MLAGETLDIIYTDPPWGDGNMKWWVTLNKKMTGKAFVPLTYAQLIARIMELSQKHLKGYLFIETGVQWIDQLNAAYVQNGLYNIGYQKLKYQGGDCVVFYGSTIPKQPFALDITNLKGVKLPQTVLSYLNKKGGIVLDPCCGMGYTAKAAVDSGMQFRGNEFNAVRLRKTIDYLQAVTLINNKA